MSRLIINYDYKTRLKCLQKMNLKQLYSTDYNLWLEKTIKNIKNKSYENMDWDNLIEEIEDMGASQKRALRSYYYKLIEHILKIRDWQSEKERNSQKWSIEINNFRNQIKDILEESPSLKNYLKENHLKWQKKVIDNYSKHKLFDLRDTNEILLEKILDDNFYG